MHLQEQVLTSAGRVVPCFSDRNVGRDGGHVMGRP